MGIRLAVVGNVDTEDARPANLRNSIRNLRTSGQRRRRTDEDTDREGETGPEAVAAIPSHNPQPVALASPHTTVRIRVFLPDQSWHRQPGRWIAFTA